MLKTTAVCMLRSHDPQTNNNETSFNIWFLRFAIRSLQSACVTDRRAGGSDRRWHPSPQILLCVAEDREEHVQRWHHGRVGTEVCIPCAPSVGVHAS
jgi:hypothetical protein